MPERAGHNIEGHERDEDDYYATRPELAKLICQTLKNDFIAAPQTILEPSLVLEPGCGSGSWLPGIRETWPKAEILGIERNPDLANYSRARGFTVEQRDILEGGLGRYDLIVGNPPYKYADEIIPMLISCLNPGGVLTFLLRMNYLEGQERYESLWKLFPLAAMYPLPARPGFTPNGATDGTGYAVMCWKQGYSGSSILRHLDNRLIANKWDGKPAAKKDGKVVRPEVLDPNFPDPRKGRMLADLNPDALRRKLEPQVVA